MKNVLRYTARVVCWTVAGCAGFFLLAFLALPPTADDDGNVECGPSSAAVAIFHASPTVVGQEDRCRSDARINVFVASPITLVIGLIAALGLRKLPSPRGSRAERKHERQARERQEIAALHWTLPQSMRIATGVSFAALIAMTASVLAIGMHVFFRDVVDLSGILAGMIATSIGLATFATASLILRNRLRCAGLQVTLDGIAEHNPLRTARLWRFTDIARIDTMGETVWIVTHNNIERLGSLRAGSQLSASTYRDVEAIARALRDEVAQRQGLHQADFLFTDAERITLRRRARLGTAAGLLLGAIAVFVRWRWNL